MDDQLPTILSLPPSLPYPITLHSLLLKPGTHVNRGQTILRYSYVSTRDENGRRRDGGKVVEFYGTWESGVEGEMVQWEEGVRDGMIIDRPGQPIIHIQQPCSHPVEFSGMCAICGKDLTTTDYLTSQSTLSSSLSSSTPGPSFPSSSSLSNPNQNSTPHPSSSTSVEITHSTPSLRVSLSEAHRLSNQTRQLLLQKKKLILVVDLDQTVIHAACDPTVGEWMDEMGGEGWGVVSLDDGEGEGGKQKSGTAHGKGKGKGKAISSGIEVEIVGEEDVTSPKTSKSINPNHQALHDVFRFQLPNELPADRRGKGKGRGGRRTDGGGDMCWYYVKPRPGLHSFLTTMSTLFEMHVYTAGSRSYANAVCLGIDPTGQFFNERILSRDESGSASVKDLRRLFPTDQSMVVVIDDRWEVWGHGPNLVKVVPFDFFVGMGDINSAFVQPRATDDVPSSGSPSSASSSSNPPSSPSEPILIPGPSSVEEGKTTDEILALQQAQEIEDQVEGRPLLKKMDEMAGEVAGEMDGLKGGQESGGEEGLKGDGMVEMKAVLTDKDKELVRVDYILRQIHSRFFAELAKHSGGYRVPPSQDPNPKILFDVRHIIPHMQKKVFAGCVFLFSGMMDIYHRPEDNEFWRLSTLFGAKCVTSLTPHVTHLIAGKSDTQKVYEGLRMSNVRVVWKDWLRVSLDMWHRQDEEGYLVVVGKSGVEKGEGEVVLPEGGEGAGEGKGEEEEKMVIEPEIGVGEESDDVVAQQPDRVPEQEQGQGPVQEEELDLAQDDFDEMDAELAELMGSDDDGSSETSSLNGMTNRTPTGNASASGSDSGSRNPISSAEIINQNNKRPRKSSLRNSSTSSSPNPNSTSTSPTSNDNDEDDDLDNMDPTSPSSSRPVKKRARFTSDTRADQSTDYQDLIALDEQEDYDEYEDENVGRSGVRALARARVRSTLVVGSGGGRTGMAMTARRAREEEDAEMGMGVNGGLSDGEGDDVPEERNDGGMDREMMDMIEGEDESEE